MDLMLTPTSDGLEITIDNGAPKLAGGLDNAVYLSLFTGPYWGDALAQNAGRYTSRIPEIMTEGMLTNQARLNIIEEAKNALAWMVSDNIADRIEAEAEIPASGTLYLAIRIHEPRRDDGRSFAYGLNWDDQKITIREAS